MKLIASSLLKNLEYSVKGGQIESKLHLFGYPLQPSPIHPGSKSSVNAERRPGCREGTSAESSQKPSSGYVTGDLHAKRKHIEKGVPTSHWEQRR